MNYAQWATPDSWRAMLDNAECLEHIEAVSKCTEPEYHLYRVVSIHAGS